MPNSIQVQHADAIVSELNNVARSWTGLFTAVRRWDPWYDTETENSALQSTIQVAVMPLEAARTRIARRSAVQNWKFGIGIDFQKGVDLTASGITATIDAIDKVVQDVMDFYQDCHALTGMSTWNAMGADRPEIYNPALLRMHSIWETLVMIQVEGHR